MSIDWWGNMKKKKKKMGSVTFSKTLPPIMSIINDGHNMNAVFQYSGNPSFAFGACPDRFDPSVYKNKYY